MFINKMGTYHSSYGINNQDVGFTIEMKDSNVNRVSVILDGCSEALHPDVGAGVFALLFKSMLQEMEHVSFDKIVNAAIGCFRHVMENVINDEFDPSILEDYMLFTLFILVEDDTSWRVAIIGDGCLIFQGNENKISILPINHSETPPYMAYQYIPTCKAYTDEPSDVFMSMLGSLTFTFNKMFYKKNDFKAIGIASDGLMAIIGSNEEEIFKQLLVARNEAGMKRFINKLNLENNERGGFFKDDVTVII